MTDALSELLRRFNGFEERQRQDHDTLTRMDERTRAEGQEADHRHRNMTTALQGLVTKSDHAALERRVDDVEKTQRWMVRTAVTINTAFALAMAAVGRRLGVWS